jgi:alkylhydroperoxidase family enzyme
MPRIEPAQPPYAPEVQASFDRMPKDWRPTFQLFTTLARDPRLYLGFVRGAVTYLPGSKLNIRQREVFLLRVTARAACPYEWSLRVHYFAEAAGLGDKQTHASVHGAADDAVWTPEESLLVRLADELHESCTISEALWRELSAIHPDEAILELLMLAGHYRMVAYLANGLELPLEPVGRPFPPP